MPVNAALRPVAQAFSSHRFLIYAILSTLAVVGVIVNACRNYSNFYSVAIYLGRSGRSVVFLANFCCLLALLFGKVMQDLFFGSLQPREVERLYDQTWVFVTESLLAFTIFRDEFDIRFGIMFGFLLFMKCFHWLLSDRIESMDQLPYPGPSLWFHIRVNVLFFILWIFDYVSFSASLDNMLTYGVGGVVLFANEYAILLSSSLSSMAKYLVNVIDNRRAHANGGENAPPWEDKSMYIFYIEIITDFAKLVTYLIFFAIIVIHYGLPLNMIRDVYLTSRSFITRFRALSRYRTATRDMDRRYPNASEEELAAMSDRTCIICRDEMTAPAARQLNDIQAAPNTSPKKLPCGHIFHFNCLRSWLERQQSCPTCRRTVLETNTAARPGQQQQPNGRRPDVPQGGVQPNVPIGFFGALPAVGQVPQQQQQGWLGRLVNAAAQPPLQPGQGGNAFAPGAAPGQHVGGGWGQQPQPPPAYGPFVYPFQPPQQLQPPPPFPGFYGPGGVWQPWGFGEQQQPQPEQERQPQTQHAQPQSPHISMGQPSSSSSEIPSSATGPSGSAPTTVPTTSWTESQRASTARDAAASAALRRLNKATARSTPNGSSTAINSSQVGSGTRSGSIDRSSSSSSLPSPQDWHPVSSNNSDPSIPRLIPLTDFSANSRGQFSGVGSGVPPPVAQGYRVVSAVQSRPPVFQSSSSTTQTSNVSSTSNSVHQTTSNQRSTVASEQTQQQQQQGPSLWSQLPNIVSDEQLSQMDSLTREAINERLKVLARVDEVVHRCIEELTRVRSVFPPAEGGSGASTSGIADEVTPRTNGSTVTREDYAASGPSERARGKEKEADVVDIAELDSSP